MNISEVLDKLPYQSPFLFVDDLTDINENGVQGNYTFRSDSYFYQGHFKGFPVTPGVILTECCAQIGLVCLGIFLLKDESFQETLGVAFTSSEMEYLLPVYPEEKVTVTAKKVYFRFNKLKCKVEMRNVSGKLVCKGTLAGMLNSFNNA
ncbi:MAG: 3-hydroxyacyl-ACP dehydratase FabZ family protein [Croceivirga sp.]